MVEEDGTINLLPMGGHPCLIMVVMVKCQEAQLDTDVDSRPLRSEDGIRLNRAIKVMVSATTATVAIKAENSNSILFGHTDDESNYHAYTK